MGAADLEAAIVSRGAPDHASTRARQMLAFTAVYILWGSTFLAIRYAIATIPPFLMAGARHLLAGLVLFPLARIRSNERPTRANWAAALLMGVLLLVIGNGGVSWAEQTVPSGIAALLVASVSLWMVLLDWLRPGGVRPGRRVVAGLLMGFAGLVLLVGPASLFGGAGGAHVNPLGATVLVVASLSWAAGSVHSRRLSLPRSPLLGTAMQCLAGGIVLILAGLASGQAASFAWSSISLRSALALGYLVVFGSLVGFSAYTYLLGTAPPSRVATYAYVNPVVALFLGATLAGEKLSLRTLSAAAIIIAAVVLVISARPRAAKSQASEDAAAAGKDPVLSCSNEAQTPTEVAR